MRKKGKDRSQLLVSLQSLAVSTYEDSELCLDENVTWLFG